MRNLPELLAMSALPDLDSIINSIADPIFVKDRKHCWVLLNDALCRFMGYARHELIGKSDYDFFPQAEADVFWEKDEIVFQTGEENINEEEFTDSLGVIHTITTKKSLYVAQSGEKFIVGCIRDVTDLKRAQQELRGARDRLESVVAERTVELAMANQALRQQIEENRRTSDQLRQSQKMEAIGRLAGGVAHDFNNLLNIILGYASILAGRPGADSKLQESAGQIAAAAEKAAVLTRQLLAFSRKQVLQPELLKLDDILRDLSKMLGSVVGEDVELCLSLGAAPGCMRADRGQIEQVIINLVVNARDAMPQGGNLTISTINADVADDTAEHFSDFEAVPSGQYVTLTVSDTGQGMDADTQAHIFEPFFSTKDPEKGTGLGLATVYGIVKQSGGHILVRSALGQGTTVKLYFPRISETVSQPWRATPVRPLVGRSETILLVEDQEALRQLLREVLQAKGYTVLEADKGKTALSLAKQHVGRIDLLITDVIMPGMRGWEVARHLMTARPEIKVLYISGHTDTDLMSEGVLRKGDVLLEKPFKPEVLLLKVNEALSSRRWGQKRRG